MLRPGPVIDTHVRGPPRLDSENLQVICRLSRGCIDDSMVRGMMRSAITLDHRLKKYPDDAWRPVLHHGRYPLFMGVPQVSKQISQRHALSTNATVSSYGHVG